MNPCLQAQAMGGRFPEEPCLYGFTVVAKGVYTAYVSYSLKEVNRGVVYGVSRGILAV